MAATETILVSLPQMVDLAFGSPENGVIHFHILHTILHILIKQIKQHDTVLEYRGEESHRIQNLMSQTSTVPNLNFSEYVINDQDVDTELNPEDARRGSMVIFVNKEKEEALFPQLNIALNQERFVAVENGIADLKKKFREIMELPQNRELIESVRQDNTAVQDMWQSMNVVNRLEATEEGVNKLAVVVDEVLKRLDKEAPEKPATQPLPPPPPAVPPEVIINMENTFNILNDKLAKLEEASDLLNKEGNILDRLTRLEKEFNRRLTHHKSIPPPEDTRRTPEDILRTPETPPVSEVTVEATELPTERALPIISLGTPSPPSSAHASDNTANKISTLDAILADMKRRLEILEALQNNRMDAFASDLHNIEKDLGNFIERMNTGILAKDREPEASVGELFVKFKALEDELEMVMNNNSNLLKEHEESQTIIEALVYQIQLLKNAKADKEDLEDALADKANIDLVNRKVSYVEFESMINDLQKLLQDAMSKLNEQQDTLDNGMFELKEQIDTKLSQDQIDALIKFLSTKLKLLNRKIKMLREMKEKQEAAGTKTKLLRNVNCISCDSDVTMSMINKFPTFPTYPPFPPNKSLRPKIIADMEATRSTNLCTEPKPEPAKKEDTYEDIHLINRYCGGSHTVMTPYQKVTRLARDSPPRTLDVEPEKLDADEAAKKLRSKSKKFSKLVENIAVKHAKIEVLLTTKPNREEKS